MTLQTFEVLLQGRSLKLMKLKLTKFIQLSMIFVTNV